jgi:hypothetical protein
MSEIYLNVRRSGGEVLVAACDKEVLGLSFSSGKLCIEVSRSFYCGQLVDIRELRAALNEASIANLTGNNVVSAAVAEGFIDRKTVLDIGGVKHAQFVVF